MGRRCTYEQSLVKKGMNQLFSLSSVRGSSRHQKVGQHQLARAGLFATDDWSQCGSVAQTRMLLRAML